MTRKIIEKKDVILNFLKKHKSFSFVVAIGIILIILPLIFNKINAGEDDIDLQLKDASLENSETNPYIIDSVDDFIVLQEYSKTHDCYGMYFAVGDILKNNRLTYNPNEDEEDEEGSEADGITYNLNLVGTIILEDGLTKAEFKGIGQNVAKPFRGNILFNGITIRIDTPLFCFVGSGASIEEVHLFGDVTADKFNTIVTNNAPVGMLAGMAILDSTELPLDISNVSVSHNSTIVGSGKSVGGIVGMVWANPYNKTVNYQYDSSVAATAISANTDRFVINLNTVTIPDAANFYTEGFYNYKSTYDTTYINGVGMPHNNTPGYTGGIIGDVVSCNYNYYVDVNFTALQKDPQTGNSTENGATLVKGYLDNDKFGTGGVIGHIGGRVCVKFDCNIDVTGLEKADAYSTFRGSVIGSMSRYAVCYMTEGHEVLPSTNGDLATLNETEYDGYGTAGTIFKETEESFWTESIEIAGDGTEDNPYVLADAEDMERLSVLLSTTGRYGTYYDSASKNWKSWFDVPADETPANAMSITDIVNYVRKAYFSIEADIDLGERNVVRLNRHNDALFAGSIIGKQGSYKDGNEYPTLTLNATEYQAYVALIPYAGGRLVNGVPVACEYKNFNIDGTVEGRAEVFGLIYSLNQYSNNVTYGYSDYIFENIDVNLDMKQKSANNNNMSGLIGNADYRYVTANLSEGLKLTFKDISFNGNMTTNSSGTNSYGGALAGIITIPANDMTNPENINRFQITVDGYDYTGNISCTSTSGHKVGAMIYQIMANANSYRNYNVAGRSVSFGKSALVNISDVNIHDATFTNGDGSDELGGILGYSWSWTNSTLKNINLSNVTFDTVGGYGGVLFTGHSGTMDIDGLNYDNVSVIRSRVGTSWQWNSALFHSNSGVVSVSNHNVTGSKFLLYGTRAEISENVSNILSNNTTTRIETNGVFSLEGNDPDGNKYTAINSYESPWIYTDIATESRDWKSYAQKGSRMWYNIFTNMEGNHISGTGTYEDPFIIDTEAEMVLLSNIFSRHSVGSAFEYFTDIDEMFTADELTSKSFTQKDAERAHRILTGVYVFAKDMDFSEYSFYPLNNPTGDYYGFDAYEYSGKTSLTDEELKEYCSTAISVLNSQSTVNGISLENVNGHKPEMHFRADRIAGLNINADGSEKTPEQSAAVAGEGWNKPSSYYGIHKDMQSGLFSSITGGGSYTGGYTRGSDVVINNLKFSGVVSKNNRNLDTIRGGGAFLVTGSSYYPAIYYATVDISNIDFGEAFISQTQATNATGACASGLLVDTIGAGDVNITGVKVLQNADGTANVRADALIGYQYGNSSRVILRDIDLNAVIDQGTLSKSQQEVDGEMVDVVTVDTSEVEGAWRSDNTAVSGKDSTTGKYLDPYDEYGYGFKYGYYYFYLKEGAAIYYYDVGTDIVTPGRVDTDTNLQTIQNKILLNSVQKYAYKVINVDVNPINNNITEGSGTEDAPYIIDSVGQLLALANYIKYEGDIIGYEDWWVGDITGSGYDELDPSTWADNKNIIYANRDDDETTNNRLNAVRHLASSYYKITADIDFTDPRSPFADMATNFNGIGTEAYPFSGGFIGEEKADGSNPVIYIGNSVDSYQKTFGLIRYGKGFEVSNLDFENGWKYLEDIDEITGEYSYTQTNEKNTVLISNADTNAGMVAAYIVGGDNIIKNVNVDVAVQLEANGGTSLRLGGYVGYMKAGSLKVSEIDEETFADFKVGLGDSMGKPAYTNTVNPYVSALVGDVESGYIMYDDETDTISTDILRIDAERTTTTDEDGNIICEVPDMKYYNKYGIGLCNTSDPVNQAYLDNIVDTVGRIEIVYNGANSTEAAKNTNGMLIANLENEDHVYLYSLALSSGALSAVQGTGYYNNLASCKKDEAEWADWLANENEGKAADSQITLSDDWNFPAIFKYFDFSALDNSYKSVYYGNSSMLNMANTGYQASASRRTNWTLTGPDVYDMSKFGEDFKGIGLADAAGYSNNVDWPNSKYLTMCANFDGNGRTIYLDMEKSGVAALFPYLNTENSGNSPYYIKNFTLEGSVTQTTEGAGNNVYARAAGVCGYIRYGWYTFDNITLQNMEITNLQGGNASTTAGIVTESLQGTARFYNINIGDPDSDDPANVLISSPNGTGGVAGGLVAGATRITAENINITNTTISTGSTVGGLAGNLSNNYGASNMNKITVTDCTFETGSNASLGAVVGNMYGARNDFIISIHDVTVTDNNLIAPEGANKVGRIVGAHTGAYYNKKEILKIYDTDSKDFTGPTTDKVLNCYVTSEYEDCDYFYYNDFKDLEYAEALYDILREDEEGNLLRDSEGKVIREDEEGNALVRYAECIETDLFTAPDADNDGVAEQLDLIPSTPEMDNTIVRWSSDSGTLENVINSVISSLTNGTGMINEDTNNNNISITVESLQINNGVISERPAGEESIFITQREGKYLITNNNKYDSIERDDKKTGEHIPGTFSLVHITYSIGNGTYTETITIPVFVSNMVNVDIYSKIMIGEEYDVDIMRAIKRTAHDIQVTTKNSTYTVYTEFMYSSNRIDFDEELYMNKGFRLYDAPDPFVALGTKLTLIDLTFEDDPKVYYYEVNKSDTFIPLAWFKDENGVNYQERNLNILDEKLNGLPSTRSYTTMYVNQRTFKKYDRGIEKYLLIVDCSGVAQVGNETSFSPIIMDGVETGQDDIVNKEVFYIKYRTYNTLSTYNGRNIHFVDDSVITEGEINKDKQLNVEVSFSDEATDFYWSDIKPYDYINQNKYLEVVAYLKNESGDKIMLPSGTRIKCNDAEAIYEGIKNTSAIFYYKDVMEDEKYVMLDKTQNTTTKVSFSLDFTYAKMEKLPSGNYTVCFDLVRNFNPEYPMGDDLLDTIESEPIEVTVNAEYGFRLETYGKDYLAFNIADVPEGTDSVVDFDVIMNSTLPDALAKNKQIKINFTLYKKDKDTGVYMPYSDSPDNELTDISLEITYNGSTVTQKLNEGDLEYTMKGITGADSDPVTLDAVMTIPYDADINNYKLQAEMYVDDDRRASDFFIVNISNIKH